MTERCCLNPFRWLDITAVNQENIQFSQCIRSWGGDDCVLEIIPLHVAAKMDVSRLWNDRQAVQAREQTRAHGVAAWCRGCPRLAAGLEPTQAERPAEYPEHWTHINLAYDKSCNLACLSCRVDRIMHRVGTPHYKLLRQFERAVIRPLLRHAEWAYISGLGDPFGSPAYSRLLRELKPEDAPGLRWHIQTNGIGFTRDAYRMIPTRAQIASVQFSVDAATEGTYTQLRGTSRDWRRLQNNVRFLAELRANGKINTWVISMVVQKCNWGEMHAFYELGKSLGVDAIQYNCLLNQGTYCDTDYADRAVHLSSHPAHAEFAGACDDLSTKTNPSVLLEFPRC
jgi:wyosine [tRNA(Phe)-imidazoG37] synthetase (radical SAM superfamily)